MSTGGGFTSGVVAHISHVAAPRLANSVELIRQSLDGGRIDAAGTDGLTVGSGASKNVIGVNGAVIAGLRGGGLAAEHGNGVVQADVAVAVVLREQHTLGGQSLREIWSFGVRAEGDVKAFVF